MAIKERKQITGTEAQIKGYAGHNGVLAYATDTKHLHVLSGTAGTTTKLANVSDIPAPVDISGKADKTYVDTQLSTKATKTELTTGLAGKAPSAHTHTKSQITDFPEMPDTSTLIPKTGDRGSLAGYEQFSETREPITENSPDVMLITSDSLSITNASSGNYYTKVIHWNCPSGSTVQLPSDGHWVGGSAPEIKQGLNLVVVSALGTYVAVSLQHYKDL